MLESFDKLCRIIAKILLAIGSTSLAAMMFLIMADVVLRYVLKNPLTGSYEIIEFMMTILVPFGIVFCAHKMEHVTVDIIFDLLSKRIQLFVNCISSLIVLFLFTLVAWQNIIFISETYESRFTSSILYIPKYPFVGAVAVGFVAFCLVLLLDFLKALLETTKK